ncbi:MAG: hypothetical protein U5L04_02650 [Trueperaceae bacterium]|nr:hypothetical protein [Trueperaceae bacterium]
MASVVDERESGAGGQGGKREIYKARILPQDWPGDPIILPYAPVNYDTSISPEWQPKNLAGVQVDGYDWTRSTGRQLSFEQVYQAAPSQAVRQTFETEGGTASVVGISGGSARLYTVIKQLERWATLPTPTTQEPTLVRVELGVVSLDAHISQYSHTIERTDAQGLPTVARLSLTFAEHRIG